MCNSFTGEEKPHASVPIECKWAGTELSRKRPEDPSGHQADCGPVMHSCGKGGQQIPGLH